MTRRLFGLPGSPTERGEVVSRIALPSLREGVAVLLKSPAGALQAAAALSPVLSGDPRAAPVLRQLARGGVVTDSVALLARNPAAGPDVADICGEVCERAEQLHGEWWHSRAWLAGLAGLAHLGHPDAVDRAGIAVEAWEEGSRNRWVDTEGIGAALLVLGAMGPRLLRHARFCRQLEDLQEIPHAAFPLAAAGDRLALRQLAAHPDTAALALAFEPSAAAEALSRSLAISDAGLGALDLLLSAGLADRSCRGLVEQAAALLLSGDADLLAARIVHRGIHSLSEGWRSRLLAAPLPAPARRLALSAIAAAPGPSAPAALAILLSSSADPEWAAVLPPGQPGVEAIIRRHCADLSPDSDAAQRARRTRMLLSLSRPPAALVATQLRYGRPEAIAAALRLPDAVGLLSSALRRRRIWRSDVAVYRFRCALAAAARQGLSPTLTALAADRDLRVSMLAQEALLGVAIPPPVDHACPGTAGWLEDFQAQGYLARAA